MYYDMQSDKLYDEYAMEGIFGKLKDKMGNKKENSKEFKEKCKRDLKSTIPIIIKHVRTVMTHSQSKNLPFGPVNIYNGLEGGGNRDLVLHAEGALHFSLYKDTSITNPDNSNYNKTAHACLHYVYDCLKKEIEDEYGNELSVVLDVDAGEIYIIIK